MSIPCKHCDGTGQVPDNAYDKCDTAIFRSGGRDILPCAHVGPHEWHHTSDYQGEWHDRDVTVETAEYKHYKAPEYIELTTTTYRIAEVE